MAQKLILFLIITSFLTFPNSAFALRCGNKPIDVGDLKIEVQLACGEPFSKEFIGYIDQVKYTEQADKADQNAGKETVERIRVMSIEEWIIKDKNNYYSLVFEGNVLKTIKWAVRE